MKPSTLFSSLAALAITFTLVACGGGDANQPPANPSQITSEVSQCGGFEANASGADYCGAEKVVWRYDAAKRTLTIEDRRITLNCCGDRSVKVTRDASGIVVREIDAPENGGGRCRCSCTYDVRVVVPDVDAASTPLRIERHVTDDGDATTIFDKAIDLAAGDGEAVVDASSSAFCSPPPTSPLFSAPRVSLCGGFDANARAKQSNSGAGDARDLNSTYCDAEVLTYSLDSQSGKLSLSNNRVLLNCCGKHSVDVRKEGSRYIITETDDSVDGARCGCMCVFDFAVDLDKISGQRIEIAIERNVTDDGNGVQRIYSGTLDLNTPSGNVVLDATDVGPWCEKH